MTNQIPAPVQAFADAINNADTDAFVALFTSDGMVDDWGRQLHGHDGVRSWAGSDAIGAGAKMSILSAETEDATTRTRFSWSSSVFNGESDGIFELDGDSIASFTIPRH
ncbi:nuclear transport factor 2 family protein [Galactobacter caseinivorans]|uniref:Nuclear transport factor 2 family protein n=1 Tax=Galactobacter caseinivorans TaxID=2676123 RepID=A0A496PKK5_9MICC|nr:nuclear transport factor 2 family protein [Galactobacter caseinivorans]RKW70970.1 nuclear transport factor 2 family protein [Galactobacter caseinivorans]